LNDQVAREAHAIWQHRALRNDQQQAFDLLPAHEREAWLALADRFSGAWESWYERGQLLKRVRELEEDARLSVERKPAHRKRGKAVPGTKPSRTA
jgi:hypothetical protein